LSGLLDSSVAISPLPCFRVGRAGKKNFWCHDVPCMGSRVMQHLSCRQHAHEMSTWTCELWCSLFAFFVERLEPKMSPQDNHHLLICFLQCVNINNDHESCWTTWFFVSLKRFFLFSYISFFTWFLGRLVFGLTSLSSYAPKKVLSTLCKIPSCSIYLILKTSGIHPLSCRSSLTNQHCISSQVALLLTLNRGKSGMRLCRLWFDLYISSSSCCQRSICLDIEGFCQDCWIARLLYPPFY
jgi:hypothetical protein